MAARLGKLSRELYLRLGEELRLDSASEAGLEFRRAVRKVPTEDGDSVRVTRTGRFALVTAALSGLLMLTLFLIYFLPLSQTLTAGA